MSLDSSVMSVRRDAEEALQKELNFAAHLGLPAVMVSLTVLLIIHKNWKSTKDTTEKFVKMLWWFLCFYFLGQLKWSKQCQLVSHDLLLSAQKFKLPSLGPCANESTQSKWFILRLYCKVLTICVSLNWIFYLKLRHISIVL